MIHITLTGYHAGTPICGIERSTAPETDTFQHAPYSGLDAFLDNPDLCPNCKAEWEAA